MAIPRAELALLRQHEERHPNRKACCGATTRLWLAAYSCALLRRRQLLEVGAARDLALWGVNAYPQAQRYV